jgi:hypothetical protein
MWPMPRAHLPRAQAATWDWAGKLPTRLGSLPVHTIFVNVARRKMPPRPSNLKTLAHLPLPLLSLRPRCFFLNAAAASGDRAKEAVERAAMAPFPAPSPACALPSG